MEIANLLTERSLEQRAPRREGSLCRQTLAVDLSRSRYLFQPMLFFGLQDAEP